MTSKRWKVGLTITDTPEGVEDFLDTQAVKELFEMCNIPAGVELKVESVICLTDVKVMRRTAPAKGRKALVNSKT